jgi:hypothetical protein
MRFSSFYPNSTGVEGSAPSSLGTIISATAGDRLQSINRTLDEALSRFERDMSEQAQRHIMSLNTQQIINRIGVVNPVSGDVVLRGERLQIGTGYLDRAVARIDDGLDDGGYIRQAVPYTVAINSNVYNEQVSITDDGDLVIDGPGGPTINGRVLRVAEATTNLGHDSVVRKSVLDTNLGGRMFLQKPSTGSSLIGDLAIDCYLNQLRIFDAGGGGTLKGISLDLSTLGASINSRFVISEGGVITGDVQSSTALRAPYARIGNSISVGYVTIVEGDTTYSGRVEFYNYLGARLGYVGLGNSTTLVISAETGKNWAFDKRLDMLSGASITGTLGVSGLATLSGGAAITGGLTLTSTVTAEGTIRSRTASLGYIDLNPGDATNTGFVSFHNAAGLRYGYIGLVNTSTKNIDFRAENTANFVFTGGLVTMSGGAAVTGVFSANVSREQVFGVDTLGYVTLPHSDGTGYSAIKGASGRGVRLMSGSTSLVSFPGSTASTMLLPYAGLQIGDSSGVGTPIRFNSIGASDLVLRAGDGNIARTADVIIAVKDNQEVARFTDTLRFGLGTNAPEVTAHIKDIIRVRNGSVGYVDLLSGDATNTGRIEFNNAAGTRYGYIGIVNTTTKAINFVAENSATFSFSGAAVTFSSVPIAGGLTTTGADMALSVSTGQGFRFKVNGTDTFVFESSGRLSLTNLTIGTYGLGEWVDTTPTPTTEGGAATGLAMTYSEYTRHGKTVTYSWSVAQTAINTATGAVLIPLPFSAKASRSYFGTGKNFNTGGVVLAEATGANLRITVTNAYPMGSGAESLSGTITYQCA